MRALRLSLALVLCAFVAAPIVRGSLLWSPVVRAQEPAATAETATAGTEGTPDVDHPVTYMEFAMSGGFLMIPIGIGSLLWLTFLVERLGATRRDRVVPAPFSESYDALMREDPTNLERVRALCDAHPSTSATILRAAVDSIHEPREDLDEAVNHVAQREVHNLRRNIRLFAVIAAVSPLLGLLGTVTGMIQAFREVAIQGLGSGQAFAPGIYKALVTTAAGLLVAIPALLTYHWLMARVDHFVRQLDDMVVEFVQVYRRHRGSEASGKKGSEDLPEVASPRA